MLYCTLDEIIDRSEVYAPKTNADRIRAMSDGELAWMFMEFRVDAYATAKGDEGGLPNTQKGILKWLQQPAEEA